MTAQCQPPDRHTLLKVDRVTLAEDGHVVKVVDQGKVPTVVNVNFLFDIQKHKNVVNFTTIRNVILVRRGVRSSTKNGNMRL